MNWQPIDTAPLSSPTELHYFLAYCPADGWGAGGNVHLAVTFGHSPARTCRPVGSNGDRPCTHWMPLPEPPK
jgi:hypothetical protein